MNISGIVKVTRTMFLNSLCDVFRNKDELQHSTRVFVKWVLDVGDGKLGDINDGKVEIIIPDELLIHQSINQMFYIWLMISKH